MSDLGQVLNNDLISLDVNYKDKDELLISMCKQLYRLNYITDAKLFFEALKKREELGVTGIGHGIAIPHGISDSVIKTTLFIVRLNEAIEWESLDNENVKLIIMFVVENSDNRNNDHLKLLAEVAGKLADTNIVKSLFSAESPEQIKKILK